MKLYHGTQIQNIKKLEPVSTRDNAITKPVICFTPNSCIALFYIWNRSYKWVTFSEKENGKVVFTEHYKNMLFDFYNKVSGSIYKCDGDNPAITPSHMKGIYISETPIAIENEIQINNVYNEILKQESLGNIIIQKYNKLSLDDKDEILKSTVRAIHMQKLLISSEHVPKQEQAYFVQTHFPQAWNIASKMTKAEVNQMIYEWRASLQIDK